MRSRLGSNDLVNMRVIQAASFIELLPKSGQVFDFKIYMKTGLSILGAIAMMAAAYLDGSVSDYGRYSTLFWIGLLVFLIGLAFAISSHYYWVRAVKYEMNE